MVRIPLIMFSALEEPNWLILNAMNGKLNVQNSDKPEPLKDLAWKELYKRQAQHSQTTQPAK